MQSGDTDKLLAVKLPHLRPRFLKYLNWRVGILKKLNSGNGQMTVKFSGGVDQGMPEWLTKDDPSPKDP